MNLSVKGQRVVIDGMSRFILRDGRIAEYRESVNGGVAMAREDVTLSEPDTPPTGSSVARASRPVTRSFASVVRASISSSEISRDRATTASRCRPTSAASSAS